MIPRMLVYTCVLCITDCVCRDFCLYAVFFLFFSTGVYVYLRMSYVCLCVCFCYVRKRQIYIYRLVTVNSLSFLVPASVPRLV